MKIRNAKGRILRIRPGHLANFSGAAGYMPFIVIFSVPASFLFGIIGSLFLHFRARHLLTDHFHGRPVFTSDNDPKTGLYEFVRYARRHTLTCLITAIVTGICFFCWGQNMVYGNKSLYAPLTVILATGPLAAWVLSSLALMRLIEWRGARWTNLVTAAAIHVLLLFACIPLIIFVSWITGANL
jgi:hypothetical protein